MQQNLWIIIALVIAAAALVVWWLWRGKAGGVDPDIQHEFNKVFMTTSKVGKEALIQRWIDKKRCSRGEAMRLAIEEWRRENR